MVNAIRGTTTQTGLRVTARLDRRRSPKKVKVTDEEMRELNIKKDNTCPHWNYTIKPKPESRK